MATATQVNQAISSIGSMWRAPIPDSAKPNIASAILISNEVIEPAIIATVLNAAGVPSRYFATIIALVQQNYVPPFRMKVYTEFGSNDIVDKVNRRITEGLWSKGSGSLYNFYTSATQIASGSAAIGRWYYNVYNGDPAVSSSAEVQFAVSYGERNGGGAPSVGAYIYSKEPTKATYAQYRNILLDPEDEQFTFGGVDVDEIFVINIQRDRLKQKMDAGNWELHLSDGTDTIKLIDDSNQKFDTATSQAGRRYNIVSGSLNIGGSATIKYTPTAQAALNANTGSYGAFYPDRGLLILNAKLIASAPLSASAGLSGFASSYVTTSFAYSENHKIVYDAIWTGSYFSARNEEVQTSTNYFVRIYNNDYNLSNNPTYYTQSDGTLKVSTFIGDPHSYITTVGLYNDDNELLAVAKVGQPLLKSFDREALIKVKLNY